jgi:hypothetical protein
MKKALVLSLAVVLGLGVASFAQTLSGSWDTTVTIVPSPVSLTIDSELIVTYAVSGWSFTSDTVLSEAGWEAQEFDVEGTLGAFTLGSALVFDPAAVAFDSWEVTGGLSLAGVTFDGTFTLEPGVTTLELVGSGTAGNVGVTVDITFGDGEGCNFNFAGVDIEVDFPFCCADVISTVSFDCDGFVEATFGVEGIAIPTLPWVTLDALITFTTAAKTLVLTPNFDFGATACFDLYIDQTTAGNLTISDITISGIGLECTIGGVQFTGISYWGEGDKPGLLEDTVYWEAYQIKTTDDGCCGPFSFDITIYFLEGGAQLFDVAEIDANMSIQVATQFTFSMGIAIDLTEDPAFTSWSLGFLVEW